MLAHDSLAHSYSLDSSTVGFEETDLTGLKRMHLLARTGDLDSIERILFGKDGTRGRTTCRS